MFIPFLAHLRLRFADVWFLLLDDFSFLRDALSDRVEAFLSFLEARR